MARRKPPTIDLLTTRHPCTAGEAMLASYLVDAGIVMDDGHVAFGEAELEFARRIDSALARPARKTTARVVR